jgi:tRNA(fMet)-specific endonuclease VapC
LLRKKETPLYDEFDLIIGVIALANEMIFVTDNIKDFRHIEKLKLEN